MKRPMPGDGVTITSLSPECQGDKHLGRGEDEGLGEGGDAQGGEAVAFHPGLNQVLSVPTTGAGRRRPRPASALSPDIARGFSCPSGKNPCVHLSKNEE